MELKKKFLKPSECTILKILQISLLQIIPAAVKLDECVLHSFVKMLKFQGIDTVDFHINILVLLTLC